MKKITINLLEEDEKMILDFMEYSNKNLDSGYPTPWTEKEVIENAMERGLKQMLKIMKN